MPKKGPVITLIILKIKEKKRKSLFLFVYMQGIIVLNVCDTQKETKGTEPAHRGLLPSQEGGQGYEQMETEAFCDMALVLFQTFDYSKN